MKVRKKNECGASLVEYGLIVSLIAVVSLLGIATTGTSIQLVFCKIMTGETAEANLIAENKWNPSTGECRSNMFGAAWEFDGEWLGQ